jgi:hypothetical protein
MVCLSGSRDFRDRTEARERDRCQGKSIRRPLRTIGNATVLAEREILNPVGFRR